MPVRYILLAFFLCSAWSANAIELPPVFGNSMVLQRGQPVPVWGKAAAGAEICVSFAKQEKHATADSSGHWQVMLDSLEASAGGAMLTIREDSKSKISELKFSDVVVGEVWLCSGQSNMRFMLKQATGGAEEVRNSSAFNLRLLNFTGALKDGVTATNYFSTPGWQVCGPKTAADFSAVAYFFGKKLHRELGVPVGLIWNAVGGAPIEAFLPEQLFSNDAELRERTANWLGNQKYPHWCRERAKQESAKLRGASFHPFAPSALHEAGFAPVEPFAIRGVLWYQGESNATDTPESPALDPAPYEKMFRLLVTDWRKTWNNPSMPVYFVQLPSLNRDWGKFREVQAKLADEIPNCGMAVTFDLGEPTNVHPPNKKPVGERLAELAVRNILEE